MANNISIKDSASVDTTVKTTDNAGVHTPHHNVDSCALPTGASTEATLSSLNGKVTACNTGAVVLAAGTAAIGKLAANSGVDIGDVDVTSAVVSSGTLTTCSTVTTLTGSGVAHDAVDSGNPHKLGAKATASVLGGTPVAAADRTDLYAGTDGVLFVRPYGSDEDSISDHATNTDGSSTAFTGAMAATASQRIYLTDIALCNTSSTNITVDIRDGAAGTVLWTLSVPANGGNNFHFIKPLRFTANTAVAFDPSAAATTVTCSVNGYKSKA